MSTLGVGNRALTQLVQAGSPTHVAHARALARAEASQLRSAGNRATAAEARQLSRSVSDWWHAVEVNAHGDWWSYIGVVERATHLNTVRMDSVKSMVDNVLAFLGSSDKLKRLNVFGHANGTGMEFGHDWVDEHTISGFAADLGRLRGHFTATGFVHLQGCEVGQDSALLRDFASIVGVRVVGGQGFEHSGAHFNRGDYVDVNPDGSSSTHWWGPGWR